MGLNRTPVSRNLNQKVKLFGLELEDLMIVGVATAVAMLAGQFLLPHTTILFLPANFALAILVIATGVPGLMLLKYGKPQGYIADLLAAHMKPKEYSCMGRDKVQRTNYLTDEGETDA